MSRFGRQQRTKAEKRAAALQFVVMADRCDAEKVAALTNSYGFTLPEALKLIAEVKARVA